MVNVKLFGSKNNKDLMNVLVLLEELQLKYELCLDDEDTHVQKDVVFGDRLVLEYGDRLLTESKAIMRYIASRNDEELDLFSDAEVDRWMEIHSSVWEPAVDSLGDEESQSAAETVLQTYNKHLEDNKFLANDEYSIADICHVSSLYNLLTSGKKNTLKKYDHLYRWIKRIMKRESVENVIDMLNE